MTDLSTTSRSRLSRRDRLAAFERHKGICCLCDRRIDGVRERWIVEHVRALELGGDDAPENMAPAHEACGRAKTVDDHRRAAKAKRVKARHIGAKPPSKRPMPGSRASGLRKRMDGTVERWS